MEPAAKQENSEPVLEFKDVVFNVLRGDEPVSMALKTGEMAFLRSRSVWSQILGIRPVDSGEICFKGRTWDSRSVSDTEDDRRMIGTVVNPRSQTSARWITNLDLNENVLLGAWFDRQRKTSIINERIEELCGKFGFSDGIPNVRPSKLADSELIRAQWVRAFLPDPLTLLILENPLFHALPPSIPLLTDAIRKALGEGVAVLWISDIQPDFSNLGLEPELLLE